MIAIFRRKLKLDAKVFNSQVKILGLTNFLSIFPGEGIDLGKSMSRQKIQSKSLVFPKDDALN